MTFISRTRQQSLSQGTTNTLSSWFFVVCTGKLWRRIPEILGVVSCRATFVSIPSEKQLFCPFRYINTLLGQTAALWPLPLHARHLMTSLRPQNHANFHIASCRCCLGRQFLILSIQVLLRHPSQLLLNF